eukprot:TRINITY_DN48024_c0_g1_i1.p1 TRINITY_DN48024_c0_g1~~TRINITY_DN48024_c0_g1_i1.p1  ORF type:complete len:425 (-),score=94.24 TRINITY_DN48024_c0_g1_i1:15-1289(-)
MADSAVEQERGPKRARLPEESACEEEEESACLLCYETGSTVRPMPLPCCGKELCSRCLRLLLRRMPASTSQMPLIMPGIGVSEPLPPAMCPWCRRPWEILNGRSDALSLAIQAAAARRSALAELTTSQTGACEALRRLSVLLLLAPQFGTALNATLEALLDFASSTLAPKAVSMACAIAIGLCREWPEAVPRGLVKALTCYWEDLRHDVATGAPPAGLDDTSAVAELIAMLTNGGALRLREALRPLDLNHRSTSPSQGRFACTLLTRLDTKLGRKAMQAELLNIVNFPATEPRLEEAALEDPEPTSVVTVQEDAVTPTREHHEEAASVEPSETAAVENSRDAEVPQKACTDLHDDRGGDVEKQNEESCREAEDEEQEELRIFPVDGHPANVAFVRKLFESSGLDWLCEHESFSSLAMLSDSDDE